MKKKLRLSLILLLGCCPWSVANAGEISKEKLGELVGVEAVRLGYNLEEMEMDLDGGERRWNEYQLFLAGHEMKEESKRYLDSIRSRLAGKKYRAAYFHPKDPLTLGGDLFIFIDAFTGDVLANFRGK
jgi:hypothetical protein